MKNKFALVAILILGLFATTKTLAATADLNAMYAQLQAMSAQLSQSQNTGAQVKGVQFSPAVGGYFWSSTGAWTAASNTTPVGVPDPVYPYHVTKNANGTLEGYAWNQFFGWLKFHPGLTGPAIPTNDAAYGMKINSTNSTVTGWARSCTPLANISDCANNPNTPALNSQAGGWDGWVKAVNVTYVPSTKKFTGYAWGSMVNSWMDFSGMGMVDNPATEFSAYCSADPSTADVSSLRNSVPPAIKWEAFPSGGTAPYTYQWLWGDVGKTTKSFEVNSVPHYTTEGNYAKSVTTRDSAGHATTSVCIFSVTGGGGCTGCECDDSCGGDDWTPTCRLSASTGVVGQSVTGTAVLDGGTLSGWNVEPDFTDGPEPAFFSTNGNPYIIPGTTFSTPGKYNVFAQLTKNPDSRSVPCGTYTITGVTPPILPCNFSLSPSSITIPNNSYQSALVTGNVGMPMASDIRVSASLPSALGDGSTLTGSCYTSPVVTGCKLGVRATTPPNSRSYQRYALTLNVRSDSGACLDNSLPFVLYDNQSRAN